MRLSAYLLTTLFAVGCIAMPTATSATSARLSIAIRADDAAQLDASTNAMVAEPGNIIKRENA
jgi:hypothetical protein